MAGSSGRVACLILATRSGLVIYERFYERLAEAEKAELRAACDEITPPEGAAPGQELVGRFRGGRLVGVASGEVVFYALGTGEYTELARECGGEGRALACARWCARCRRGRCQTAPTAPNAAASPPLLTAAPPAALAPRAVAEILRALAAIYLEELRVPALTDAALFANYALTALAADEVIKEGIAEHLDRAAVHRAITLKLPVIAAAEAAPRARGGVGASLSGLGAKLSSARPSG